MNKTTAVILLSLMAATPIAAQTAAATQRAPIATEGKMLRDARGGRLAPVDRVDADGSAEIIIDGRVVTVPASTLSIVNGELTTSLKKDQVLALQ